MVSPGLVCYAEKQEKPFWFSSLGQIVQFGAIIFYRTFVELFWSVRVDRKKRVIIIVAFHCIKRRLKITLHQVKVLATSGSVNNQNSMNEITRNSGPKFSQWKDKMCVFRVQHF